MRLHISVAALAAISLTCAGTAAAAPNRSGALDAVGAKYTWSSDNQVGAVYGSPVAPHAPHCSPIFACDTTLIHTGELGDLVVDIAGQGLGGQDTLKDADVHVYASDASGTQGDLVGESTGPSAVEEADIPDVDPGYYLVLVDWYLGVGSVNGTAQLGTPTPPDTGF
jgi:hypothetical protein